MEQIEQILRLKEIRLAFGLTQVQFADIIKVNPSRLSRWESGNSYPTIPSLKRIATRLGLPISSLIKDDNADITNALDFAESAERMTWEDTYG